MTKSYQMTFDISKFSAQIAQAQQAQLSRDTIEAGEHVIRIEAVDGITSKKNGNDYILIEGTIEASTTMRVGTPVKHFYQLTGVPSWKQEGNIKALKSFVLACLPLNVHSQINQDVISKAVSGGSQSALVGLQVNCRVSKKTSKKNVDFLETNWINVEKPVYAAVANVVDNDEDGDLPF